jgi:hypothetical protein
MASQLFETVGINHWERVEAPLECEGDVRWQKVVGEHRFLIEVEKISINQYGVIVVEDLGEDRQVVQELTLQVQFRGKRPAMAVRPFLKQVMRYKDGALLRAVGDEIGAAELPYWKR